VVAGQLPLVRSPSRALRSAGRTPAKDEQTPKLAGVGFGPPTSTRAEQAVALNNLLGALRADFAGLRVGSKPDWSMQGGCCATS
jgi:hypothetical protein